MFLCQVLGITTEPGEKCNKIVTATRERTYTHKERDMETGKWLDVIEGHGWEIVSEINASDKGVQAWNAMSDMERDALVEALKQGML
jgi:hypothetical protein